jgi:hypothetical protein
MVELSLEKILDAINEKNGLSKNDRIWLFNLISKILTPSILNATTPAGSIVLAAGVSGQVAITNSNRWNLTITNAGANVAYLVFTEENAITTTGCYLGANGGAINLGRGTDIPYTGEVNAISTSGTTLTFFEFSVPPIEQDL